MKKVFIGLVFILSVRCGAFGGQLGTVDGNGIQYSIKLGSPVCVFGEKLTINLVMTNTSTERKLVNLPCAKDFLFKAQGPNGSKYLLDLNEISIEDNTDREIYLQPQCSFLMTLANATVKPSSKNYNGSKLSFGKYIIFASWSNTDLPKGKLPPLISSCILELVEYPLSVQIETPSSVFSEDDPLIITVVIKNCGRDRVRLLNSFAPCDNNFSLLIEKVGGSENLNQREVISDISLISPQSSADWITLYQNESIITDIDIGREIVECGKYNVRLTYIRPVLLISSSTNPTYTKQHLWKSNKIEIVRLGSK